MKNKFDTEKEAREYFSLVKRQSEEIKKLVKEGKISCKMGGHTLGEFNAYVPDIDVIKKMEGEEFLLPEHLKNHIYCKNCKNMILRMSDGTFSFKFHPLKKTLQLIVAGAKKKTSRAVEAIRAKEEATVLMDAYKKALKK